MLECRAEFADPDNRPPRRYRRMIFRWVFIVVGLTSMVGGAAHAIGFGRVPASVGLGSPLYFPMTIQLAPDESLAAPCVAVEVMQGEQRILPSQVRIAVEQGATSDERVVQVSTQVAIEEPVVTIIATLGCINKIERRFTVFADPPAVTIAAAPAAPAAPAVPAAAPEPAASAPATPSAEPTPRPAAAVASSTAPPVRKTARPALPRASAVTARPRASPATAVATGPRGTVPAPGAPASAASGPRLKLDPIEPLSRASAAASAAQEAALRVAAMAASAALAEQAASAAQANANAAVDRMRAVEQALAAVRADAQRDRDELAQLRTRLSDGDAMRRIVPWLIVGLTLLAALAAGLWWRLRRVQRQQQAQWWAAAQAANRQPPVNPPTLQPMTLPPHLAPTPAVQPPRPKAPQPAQQRQTSAGTPSMFSDSMMAQPPRDVSIEELIDLEQQAEFFVVLGQDDSAIDLLMGHIRSSGGTSALPYLKLLEIYRRLGDRESYERTRARFNHRFNAYAPDWDADLQHGRSLEEYPGVMQRLQSCWSEPMDAMAELESLMFRRDAGELFELPAYREVLFLYSMARDLLDHQGGQATSIDVLLPLAENQFETTTAHPHLLTMPPMSSLDDLNELVRATEAPVSFLSAAIKATPAARVVPDSDGEIDLDLTKPLPMFDDSHRSDRGPDGPRSDPPDLPPEPGKR